MINLPNDMAIDADKRQFILKEKKVRKEGNNQGEVYWKEVGFYSDISGLLTALFDRKMYESVTALKTLERVQEELRDWADSLQSPLIADLKEAVRKLEGTK